MLFWRPVVSDLLPTVLLGDDVSTTFWTSVEDWKRLLFRHRLIFSVNIQYLCTWYVILCEIFGRLPYLLALFKKRMAGKRSSW